MIGHSPEINRWLIDVVYTVFYGLSYLKTGSFAACQIETIGLSGGIHLCFQKMYQLLKHSLQYLNWTQDLYQRIRQLVLSTIFALLVKLEAGVEGWSCWIAFFLNVGVVIVLECPLL